MIKQRAIFSILLTSVCSVVSASTDDVPAAGKRVVSYEDFGARADGETDDFQAIVKAHAYANQHGLPVKAKDGGVYYIGGRDLTAFIQTDTDFGTATFIIDDRELENIKAHVFSVQSKYEPYSLSSIHTLKRNQERIDASLAEPALIRVENSRVKHFIRKGGNQNAGSPQLDVFLVDAEGNIDMSAPVIWDFEQITEATAYPIDEETLTITGGVFKTVANQAESKYNYHQRNLAIRRSNVVVERMEHHVTDEGKQGAPYGGFFNIANSSNVTIKNCKVSGRKAYRTIGSAGKPVSMGSYDILVNNSIDVSFINCKQINDIHNKKLWGLMASNYSKNLLLDGCSFSRFDAHKGVTHATIRNSTLGHMGCKVIGGGKLTLENTKIYAREFISLRPDYGSNWQGEFVIRSCHFYPKGKNINLVFGRNLMDHDFGYPCSMPERITIDGLHIHDSKGAEPVIFADFNPTYGDADESGPYPYAVTREVALKNVTTESGNSLKISKNAAMFKDVRMVSLD
ncbi:MAG: right-handed parallel beta-helix repeat-containing protein [Opitutales bacterium]